MADIKRDIFKKNRTIGETQQKVVFQQKKPLLNYELNLLQDIADGKFTDLAKLSIGNNYSGDAFKVVADPQSNPLTIFVTKGVFYHNGFPIVLEDDVLFDDSAINGLSAASVPRTDTIYVEWFIDEVDASEDPEIKDASIGFETTRQHRVKAMVKCSENSDPVPLPESISFSSAQRSITLLNGIFPDWLRVVGSKFITSSLENEKSSSGFFEVEGSPTPNVVILKSGTSLVDETLSYTKFYEYDVVNTSAKQKEFVAYRRNFFTLAKINRTVGSTILDADIIDERQKAVYNFVKSGCAVKKLSNTSISIDEGEVFVGDINHYIESGVTFSLGSGLSDNSLNFVYVNNAGYVQTSLTEPTEYHLILAEVKVKNGQLWGNDPSLVSYGYTDLKAIEDLRSFIPLSWNYKYGDEGGTGETGFTTLVLKFKADESISDRDLVYLSSSNGISKANSTVRKVPAIGIVPQAIPVGEINNVVIIGEIENSSWNFTPGALLYVGSGGVITQTPPTIQNSYVQRVGVAITSKRIFVKPDVLFIKNDISAGETALVSLNSNGDLEVIGYAARISSDRSSFLAPIALSETGSSVAQFKILPGRFYLNDSENYHFAGLNINMETGGNFETTGIPSNNYNKAFFTIRDDLSIQMYESISDPVITSVLDPEIPDNEMPICVITFKGLGDMAAGNIYPINQADISDKRNWLNLGNLDNSSFKPVYRDNTNFIVQKGGSWFNSSYITLDNNEQIVASTSVGSSKFIIYLDIQTASGIGSASSSDFVTMLSTTIVDRRRYIPLGEYSSVSSKITRSTFKSYSSKFWKFRDKPYSDEQTFLLTTPTSAFTLTTFSFLSSDFLDATINGRKIYENEDFVKSAPSNVMLNFNAKTGAKVKIRKV